MSHPAPYYDKSGWWQQYPWRNDYDWPPFGFRSAGTDDILAFFRFFWMEQKTCYKRFPACWIQIFHDVQWYSTGWRFGTFFIFPYAGDNHPNWRTHIFQRGGEKPPTSRVDSPRHHSDADHLDHGPCARLQGGSKCLIHICWDIIICYLYVTYMCLRCHLDVT